MGAMVAGHAVRERVLSKAKTPQTGRRSRVPLVLAFAAACAIAPLAFLVLLPGPPEREEDAGGKITVTKQVPDASGDSGPEPQSGSGAVPLTGESTAERGGTQPEGDRRALADATRSAPSASQPAPGDQASAPSGVPGSTGRMELTMPETESPQQSREPAGSSGSAGDESGPPDPAGEETDASAQASGQAAQESAQDSASEQASTEAPETSSQSSQETPDSAGQATSPSPDAPGSDWQMDLEAAEEPPEDSQQASTSEESSASGAGNLPSETELGGWIESQAKEFLGGVDEEGNILYRFDVWVSAPPALHNKIKSVAYSYDAPSATPESQESVEPRTQFKVSFGALSCAKEVAVTITLEDGSTRKAVVNGCQILN